MCLRRRVAVTIAAGIAVGGDGAVVRPLVGRVEVSKRVERAIHVVVVVAVAAVGRVRRVRAVVVVEAGLAGVVATVVVCGVKGTRCVIYPGIVTACCHAYAHACAVVADADAAIWDPAGGRCAVGLLAGVSENATLAVAWVVDVLVARFGVGLHAFVDGLTGADIMFQKKYWVDERSAMLDRTSTGSIGSGAGTTML